MKTRVDTRTRLWYQRLKLQYDGPLSNSALHFNLRNYSMASSAGLREADNMESKVYASQAQVEKSMAGGFLRTSTRPTLHYTSSSACLYERGSLRTSTRPTLNILLLLRASV